ncbi:MAG TPA: hypothetical protein EYP41_14995 [Anaerolineae bacterium]|nr:hypothetical protein [Anaerolineae bacterium]HIP69764.1 hypothetical protein [Anaerolineae bacterium]
MTKATKTNHTQPIVIFIFIILALFLSACATEDIGIRYSNPDGSTASATSAIVFAGKVTDKETGRWLNNYTAIVFRNGNEIGRIDSQRGEYKYSGQGVHDGLFAVYVPNDYQLTAADEFVYASGEPLTMKIPPGQSVDSQYIYKWFGELSPGAIIRINVPAKQIQYTIAVLPRPDSELSEEYLNNPTIIDENGRIQAILTADNTGSQPDSLSLVSQATWNRSLARFDGTIEDAWRLYVENQVRGITWEQFQVEVVQHNTQLLDSDGVFQHDETYVMPVPDLVDLN